MDKEKVIKIVQKYSERVSEYFNVKKIILFGSYSNSTQNENSDIDVAVFLEDLPNNIIEAESRLFKLRRDIDARIEPLIVDEKNDLSGFVSQILKDGIVIFQRN